jgi:hypothetical protein
MKKTKLARWSDIKVSLDRMDRTGSIKERLAGAIAIFSATSRRKCKAERADQIERGGDTRSNIVSSRRRLAITEAPLVMPCR